MSTTFDDDVNPLHSHSVPQTPCSRCESIFSCWCYSPPPREKERFGRIDRYFTVCVLPIVHSKERKTFNSRIKVHVLTPSSFWKVRSAFSLLLCWLSLPKGSCSSLSSFSCFSSLSTCETFFRVLWTFPYRSYHQNRNEHWTLERERGTLLLVGEGESAKKMKGKREILYRVCCPSLVSFSLCFTYLSFSLPPIFPHLISWLDSIS